MSKVITLTELKGYIDGDVDATRGAIVVDAVNQAVETITGRVWGEIESGSETHDYASEIFLRNMDVIAVTDVRQNGTSRAANSYHFNSNGRLSLSTYESGFYPRWNEIEVTYTHGNLLVPADLKLAALALASDYYTYAADGQKEVTAEGVGSLRFTYASGKNTATGSEHFATLDRYRMRGL